MTDAEPKGWELQRALTDFRSEHREGMAGLNNRLDRLVSLDKHAADLQRIDSALVTLAQDIAEEKTERAKADADEKAAREKMWVQIDATMQRMVNTIRWVAGALIVPIVLFVAALLSDRGAI